jgi:hypothetical protein
MQEAMWIAAADEFDATAILELKQILNPLFYIDDVASLSDPNHPINRFGVVGDVSGNVRRLEQALDEIDMPSSVRAIRNRMFNRSSELYTAMRIMLRAFIAFGNVLRDASTSDEDSSEEE